MTTKICPHCIPQHWSQFDEQMLREWSPISVKVVWSGYPAHIDSIVRLNPEFIIVRDYVLADAGKVGVTTVEQARERAREHAAAHKTVAYRIEAETGYPISRILFEGWNEPPIWLPVDKGGLPPLLVDAYEDERMLKMDQWGGRAAVGNFNTGHPDNSGPGTDPNWFWFPLIKARLEKSKGRHGLAIHEYCAFTGPNAPRQNGQGGWTWDMGRYTRNHWDCDIYITECGADNAVYTGREHEGWQRLPYANEDIRAQVYSSWLIWYAEQLHKDSRVKAAYAFTNDSQSPEWTFFGTNTESFRRIFIPMHWQANFEGGDETVQIVDVVDTLPRHPVLRYQTRPISQVSELVIHHTAGPGNQPVKEIANYHINADPSRGKDEWPGIGYHFYALADGTLYQTNRLETISYHSLSPTNERGVAVCLAGTFLGNSVPTDKQLRALETVIEKVQNSVAGPLKIIAHKMAPYAQTQCPGDNGWYEKYLSDGAPPQPVWPDDETIRNVTYGRFGEVGIPYAPTHAFIKEARRLGMGEPLTREFDEGDYRLQAFGTGSGSQAGVLVAKKGEWDKIKITLLP